MATLLRLEEAKRQAKAAGWTKAQCDRIMYSPLRPCLLIGLYRKGTEKQKAAVELACAGYYANKGLEL